MSDTSPDGGDEDGEVDLGISLETVATVVDHIRAIQEGEDSNEVDTEDEDPDDDGDEEDFDEETLAAFIEDLNEDEQAALVALAWVGRGDYEPEEWAEAVRLAKERSAAGDTSSYLLGMDMAGDLLAEGLAAFGLAVEEIER
ncbi:DUF3775 domain-containing protein [Teichococcus vastitatis]|jgi:hypothetical protein|uniref:DUF3775 domain-containing protein n=1 Tax=Teichococcus vastitatis TaxID=2307076 RepID=A0ABS9WD89_9PROT|nr:DUF3775 domain-containing protein [Pseudoroseomonas vastitatis]MCI0756865.1 DUF3775 domain-containing protein [Pseudoroseomonas vastitatis]